MHKRDQESILVNALMEGQTITVACKKAGVSRMFYDRHYKSDRAFRKAVDAARAAGCGALNDLAETMHAKLMRDGNWQAIRYRLAHHVEPYNREAAGQQADAWHGRALMESIPRNDDGYALFIAWSAMTPSERKQLGVETEAQFCKKYRIKNSKLPVVWSRRDDFQARVAAERERWMFAKTSDIVGSIFASASAGDPRSQRLWLNLLKVLIGKDEKNSRPALSSRDIMFMVESLPEPLRSENYTKLREIMDVTVTSAKAKDAKEYQEAGLLDEDGEIIEDVEDPLV